MTPEAQNLLGAGFEQMRLHAEASAAEEEGGVVGDGEGAVRSWAKQSDARTDGKRRPEGRAGGDREGRDAQAAHVGVLRGVLLAEPERGGDDARVA